MIYHSRKGVDTCNWQVPLTNILWRRPNDQRKLTSAFAAALAVALAWVTFVFTADFESAEALGTQSPQVDNGVTSGEVTQRVASSLLVQGEVPDPARVKIGVVGLEPVEAEDDPQPTCRNICVKWHTVEACDYAGNCARERICCKREWKCDYFG